MINKKNDHIIRALAHIRKNGISKFLRGCYYLLSDLYYEKHFNVNTKGSVSIEDLGITSAESVHYSPLFYRHIIGTLDKIPAQKKNSTVLDYGCGKGRVIISAASYQFNKIIGIEISDLIKVAKKNVEKMDHKQTINIELVQCDAQDFNVPSDVNIIFFYNPFTGSTLRKVTENIHSSYEKHPRKIYIIYFNNNHFDKVIADQNWLVKISQYPRSKFYPDILCGLYETTP